MQWACQNMSPNARAPAWNAMATRGKNTISVVIGRSR